MKELGTGLYYDDNKEIMWGDEVTFIYGEVGKIVFESGAFGIGCENCIDYDKIQKAMDETEWCCGNSYSGCCNDNFITLWEIVWNFNCEDETIDVIRKVNSPKPTE